MLDFVTKAFSKIFGTKSEKDLKEILPYIKQIHAEGDKLLQISDDELRAKTIEFKEVIKDHLKEIDGEIAQLKLQIDENPQMEIEEKEEIFGKIDKLEETHDSELEVVLLNIMPQAFAVVKETARRLTENKQLVVTANDHDKEMAAAKSNVTIDGDKAIWSNKWIAAGNEIEWNMIHYDVQLIGGIVLHKGMIAEMQTGEGKTLVSTLPSYLNALAGKGVHLVTVNDYLAVRDSEWNAPLFEFHGMRVDCIDKHQPHSQGRISAYKADITYGTNNEFGFDYLRDNMARSPEEQVQLKHHFAMVDEVDSVLIDDARTPLIISGPVPDGDKHEFNELKPLIDRLVSQQRQLAMSLLNDAKKQIKAGDKDNGGLALFRAYRALPKYKPLIKFLGEPGMLQLMQSTENIYMAENNKRMPEADEPLFFTIDEKRNSVDLTDKGIDHLTQNLSSSDKEFFILPDIGIEVDEIEKDENLSDEDKLQKKDELISNYSLKTQRIHSVNQLLKAYTLFEKDVDYILADNKVMIVDEQTGRVMDGRRYSDGLHQALEAKEGAKIEAATQTYATITLQNFFRMYHKLSGMTGTAETEAGEFWEIYKLDVVSIPTNRPIQRHDREDKVYKTVREKFNAVAQEIQELVAENRPVLVGTTSVENSEVLSRMLQMRKIPHQVLNAKQHAREADVVAQAGLPGQVTIATNMAGRGTDIKLSKEVKDSGGLAIIGTERHDSRRVDRQLRGRAGRQGDPGSSQFFVSLEDNLMRMFGSDRIAKVMDRMGLEEGEVIQHSMISKSIERAQKKVEENNFAMRKRLLEYDDVMNSQREVIYKRRNHALYGDRLTLDIMNNFYDVAFNISEVNQDNFDAFKLDVLKYLGLHTSIKEEEFTKLKVEQLSEKLYTEAYGNYKAKNQNIKNRVLPVFNQLKEDKGGIVANVAVPITDGRRFMQVNASLDKVIDSEGGELVQVLEQNIMLSVIDQEWKEHLRDMDELKQQVQNAVHEQKDPLLIYKFEGFQLFKGFLNTVNEEATSFLSKAQVAVADPSQVQQPQRPAPRQPEPKLQEQKAESQAVSGATAPRPQAPQSPDPRQMATNTPKAEVTKPIKSEKTYHRNDRVNVRYKDGTVKENVKFKTVEQDLELNNCVIIEG
ncbi:preprotein translocase subunit SecA [Sediminitomix flava]|uniref:Protein translocase subunit SecA n=1 Tax=Sediminitomix flava TaxID=379075 RepID=A0A315YWS0_SEDFL|nr:preprotein translocase subunit SecA [Sediminitomix flava]PWJ34220.1 protein translocase subunit secA [Sediminitomix flava]